jgi:hypothetical protein
MSGDGKHRFDSGRARQARQRDRADGDFNDQLIRAFFGIDDDAWLLNRRNIPVRYGSRRLADHLSDSTIAAAILDSGDLDDVLDQDDSLKLDQPFPQTLFDCLEPPQPQRLASPEPDLPAAAAAPPDEQFSVFGLFQGFLMGAGATVAVLILMNLLT